MVSDLVSQRSVLDPRADRNKLYPLKQILLLSSCSVVSGAAGVGRPRRFRTQQTLWVAPPPLFTRHSLHDYLGWLMTHLPERANQDPFVIWAQAATRIEAGEVVAICTREARYRQRQSNFRRLPAGNDALVCRQTLSRKSRSGAHPRHPYNHPPFAHGPRAS